MTRHTSPRLRSIWRPEPLCGPVASTLRLSRPTSRPRPILFQRRDTHADRARRKASHRCGLAASGIVELGHCGGNGFREPLGDRSRCGRLKPDLIPLPRVRLSRASVAAPDQVVANGGQVGARLTALQGSQALRDARTGLAVAEDFQRRLQAFKVIDRSRTASGSPLRVRVIRSCCWRTRLASSDRRALASDRGTGVAATHMAANIGRTGLVLTRRLDRGGTMAITATASQLKP